MNPRQFAYHIEYEGDLASQRGHLVAGKDFQLGFEALRKYFGGDLPPRLLDLLRVAMAVYVVDRLVRRQSGPCRSWRRNLRVRVEMLDPGFWTDPEVLDALQETVGFVSGDGWDFQFIKSSVRYEWTRPLPTDTFANESPLNCLYSGGLDSAPGLGLRLSECPDRLVLPVTVKHQPRQNDLIKTQFKKLRNRFGARIEPLVVKAELIRSDGSRWSKEESSQRGRSFLFVAVGAVATAMAGVASVEVFESGIGAINVPLMAGMTGSKATRGCHPEFLRLMSRLASLVAGREVIFRLPFLDRTKGEMVRELNDCGLSDLARGTVSCAHYPVGYHRYKQCGVCSACLFRRQAMLVAGIDEPTGSYSFDLFGPPDRVNSIPSDKIDDLKAFLRQVAEWAEIDTSGRLPGPVERHLRRTRILKPGESSAPIAELLARNRDEWLKIAAEGRRKDYRWAMLLAPARTPFGQGVSHAPA
jgi:7-cyano-7-deazaguanine synthase in queuosine biosynthesis